MILRVVGAGATAKIQSRTSKVVRFCAWRKLGAKDVGGLGYLYGIGEFGYHEWHAVRNVG